MISPEQFMELRHQKKHYQSFDNIREDIVRFIPNEKVLDIWSPQYFKNLAEKMKFK
jgi:hypothetical protein